MTDCNALTWFRGLKDFDLQYENHYAGLFYFFLSCLQI